MKKILTLAILSSLSTAALAQSSTPQSHSDIEVTATVDAGCDLTADNINFGILMMPLSDNSAQSNMKIKCSKGANLEVAINYSENIASSSSNFRLEHDRSYNESGESVHIYDGTMALGSLYCHKNPTNQGWAGISAREYQAGFLNSIGLSTNLIENWLPDTNGLCEDTPSGFALKTSFLLMGSIGALTGLSAGEQIKYSLELPSDSSKAWNSSNKHTFTGTGVDQTIPMKANIKRADNPTHRMTPDTYQSTLTVVLSY